MTKKFIKLVTGSSVYSLSQWIIPVLLINYYSLSNYDNYAEIMSIITPLFLFINMNLRSVITSDYENSIELEISYQYKFLIGLLIFSILGLWIIVTGEVLVFPIILISLKFVDSLFDNLYGYYQKSDNFNKVGRSFLLRGLITIILLFLGGLFSINIYLVFFLLFLTIALLSIFEHRTFNLFSNLSILFDFKFNKIGRMIRMTGLLSFVAVIDALNINIPKYFLFGFNNNLVGIFSSLIILIYAGGFIVSALGNLLLPKFSEYFNKKEVNKIKSIVLKISFAIVVLGLISLVIVYFYGSEFLQLIYNKEIANYNVELNYLWVFAIIWFLTTVLSFTLYSISAFKEQFYIYIIMLFCTIISNFFLTPTYFVLGAIISFGISQVVRLFTTAYFLNKLLVTNNK